MKNISYLVYLGLGLGRIDVICFSFSASFSFSLIIQPHLNRCTFLFFVRYLEYLLLFLDENIDEESE